MSIRDLRILIQCSVSLPKGIFGSMCFTEQFSMLKMCVLAACTSDSSGTVDAGVPGRVSQSFYVYLVDVGGQGNTGDIFGCDDRIVPVKRVSQTTGSSLPVSISAALNELFAVQQEELDALGLYSALLQSDLNVTSVRIEDRQAVVALQGRVLTGGHCDDPRFYEQIERTVAQFGGITGVRVLLNGSEEEYESIGD
jgi:hypothetical protein